MCEPCPIRVAPSISTVAGGAGRAGFGGVGREPGRCGRDPVRLAVRLK
jgi:hypothetical protein